MSDSEQPITDAEIENRPKRKYVQSGRPRDNLWARICQENGITNYKKGTESYNKARELYEIALQLKKNKISPIIMDNTENNSMQKIAFDNIYVDEPEEVKKPDLPKVSNKKRPLKDLHITTK